MEAGSLDGGRVAARLPAGAVIGRRVEVHESVGSTNDVVAEAGKRGEAEGLVVVAESQGAGRGRMGRQWSSRPGRDLLFSVLLKPPGEAEGWSWLVHGAAVGICRALDELAGVRAGIKWPNDIYLPGDRKVCGILMEAMVGGRSGGLGYAVLGVGLNVKDGPLPAGIRDRGITLEEASGREVDREALLVAILSELNGIYGVGSRQEVIAEAERRSVLQGRRIAIGEGEDRVRGHFLGLGEGGCLRLQEDGGKERIFHSSEHLELID